MVKQKKIALNTFDDKRCYFDRNISVLWGHNLSSKKTQKKQLKFLLTKFIPKDQSETMSETKLMLIISMTNGAQIYSILKITVLKTIEVIDTF